MLDLSVEEVKSYLGIDYSDVNTNKRLDRLIKVADKYLEGSLGKDYPVYDYRVNELALIVISDLYDNHDLTEKVSGNIRKLVSDFSLQIRLEMRREKDGI